ncbi:MAG: SDR family oxidoreductase [Synechococcales cyanobacterium]
MDVREPVVIITGGSAGIGKATAQSFAQQGSRLVLVARHGDPLRQVALELERQWNTEVMTIPMDTRDPEDCRRVANQTLERFGQIDVLINNAGICLSGAFADTTLADWQEVFNVNLWGYVQMIQAVLPTMVTQQRGQIVNVGSLGGKVPFPKMSAYCASKYAVAGLTASLRLELHPLGIGVSAVHPGVVRSDFLQRAMFIGDANQQAQLRQSLQQAQDNSWLSSDPETVAAAIWEATLTNPAEITVGWVAALDKAYQFFPDGVGSLLRGA